MSLLEKSLTFRSLISHEDKAIRDDRRTLQNWVERMQAGSDVATSPTSEPVAPNQVVPNPIAPQNPVPPPVPAPPIRSYQPPVRQFESQSPAPTPQPPQPAPNQFNSVRHDNAHTSGMQGAFHTDAAYRQPIFSRQSRVGDWLWPRCRQSHRSCFCRLVAATVIINSFHSRDAGEETAAEINGSGGQAIHLWGSVANPDQVDAMFSEIESRFGRLDILVCNASDGKIGSFMELTPDDYDRAFRTNVSGHHQCAVLASKTHAARRRWIDRDHVCRRFRIASFTDWAAKA